MRSSFINFPEDQTSWTIEDEHMLGNKYLIAPIFDKGLRKRKVYLPSGVKWKNVNDGSIIDGGNWIICDSPINQIPVFERI